jgi:hypothetical protein
MKKSRLLLVFLPLFFAFSGFAQNGLSTWFELGISKKITKNLKIEFNPELRLLGGFKMDSYILEGGLSYNLHQYLTVAGYYRYEDVYDYKNSTGEYKDQTAQNRIALDIKTGFEWKRLDVQFRLRYTNGADFDQTTNDKASYFRYRAKTSYDIKGSKLVPFASVEVFHDLILKEVDKIRYTGGLEYPFNKKNELSLFYRLQDYSGVKQSVNIIGIGYSLKL